MAEIRSIHNTPIPSTSPVEDAIRELEELIVRIRAGEFSPQYGLFCYVDAESVVNTYRINPATKLECVGLLAYAQKIQLND